MKVLYRVKDIRLKLGIPTRLYNTFVERITRNHRIIWKNLYIERNGASISDNPVKLYDGFAGSAIRYKINYDLLQIVNLNDKWDIFYREGTKVLC